MNTVEAANRTLQAIMLRGDWLEPEIPTHQAINSVYSKESARAILAYCVVTVDDATSHLTEDDYEEYACEKFLKGGKKRFMAEYIPNDIDDYDKSAVFDFLLDKKRILKIGSGEGRYCYVTTYYPIAETAVNKDKSVSQELSELAEIVLKAKKRVEELELQDKQASTTLKAYNTWR